MFYSDLPYDHTSLRSSKNSRMSNKPEMLAGCAGALV